MPKGAASRSWGPDTRSRPSPSRPTFTSRFTRSINCITSTLDRPRHGRSRITLKKLNRELDRYGLALTNMGDIDKQSIAGAVSTGTHGTGLAYGGIATQIRGLRMITPNGDVVDIDANHEPELFRCARVGLGALGIITRVTLQAVPSFRLHAVESSHSLDDVLEAWPDTIRANDHAEFFFMPGGRNAARKINNRTDEPAAPSHVAAMSPTNSWRRTSALA